MWQKPITDRTQSDIDRVVELITKIKDGTASASEISEYTSDMKGALNDSDIERIRGNIAELSTMLKLDIYVEESTRLPNQTWYNKLLVAVEALRNNGPIKNTTPLTPQSPLNTFTKWNEIETILFDIHHILESRVFHYCNDSYYSGNEIGLIE